MNLKKYSRNPLIWIIPAILLLFGLFPMVVTGLYGLYGVVLQIVVCLASLFIAYLLFVGKPTQYYVTWGVIFLVIAVLYNPLIKMGILMTFIVPFNLITAIIFIVNWLVVFQAKKLK